MLSGAGCSSVAAMFGLVNQPCRVSSQRTQRIDQHVAGDYKAASALYGKALRYVRIRSYGPDNPPPMTQEQAMRATAAEVACVLNRAACRLKLGDNQVCKH